MITPVVQPQNDTWSCALCTLEYMTGTPRKQIAEEIGHDGSEIVAPDAPLPYNRAAYYDYETMLYLFQKGHTPTKIQSREFVRKLYEDTYAKRYALTAKQIAKLLPKRTTELCVVSHRFPKAFHAVACLNDVVLDPRDGCKHAIDEYTIISAIFTNIDPFQRLSMLHAIK
jgi:hypothetical protein